ncbi:Uroporphyrin-III c-methyltransferase [Mycena kentingensis (nom. inval.)]|nr:Uroporphyrin-III c-methyltransferase [Mycena kentingensis (nom. inval.)]
MARFLALLSAALAGAAVVNGAASVDKRATDLITFFIDLQFSGNSTVFTGNVPTGCQHPPAEFVNSVSSVIIADGVGCTLWGTPNCGLSAGPSISLQGRVPDLVALGFNDVMDTFECLPK